MLKRCLYGGAATILSATCLLADTPARVQTFSFAGEWPKESRQGAPGPVHAFLAGWIDGDSGKGRMRVEGRSDGGCVANRKK